MRRRREGCPVALSLTGATGYRYLRESSPDKAPCAAAGKTPPVALSLTGATGHYCLREGSPDKAPCAAAGKAPRWRCRLPGLRGIVSAGE
ncbi:hypothetical protein TUM17576_44300 [Enterobacter hormaechei]|uniref:Uncharacterized protein n=1 Tax=Phytobacter ursingii TaxID=1972431 RepID=A0AB35RMA3_9ENTR|nr:MULTISPECIES: hypothetical protein [Enterobacteriaceae]MDV2863253.1 hypothetical protein [Phytobacter ursingii]GJL37610.1 hypothetical protein TUM17576_44300 [Enterobacter hormaechei]